MQTCEFVTFPLFSGTFLSFDFCETIRLGLLLGRFLGIGDALLHRHDVGHRGRIEVPFGPVIGVCTIDETGSQFDARNVVVGFVLPSAILRVATARGVFLVRGIDLKNDLGFLQSVFVFLICPLDAWSFPVVFGVKTGDGLGSLLDALLKEVSEPQTGDGVCDLGVHDVLLAR